jgi:hypothetical protein
LPARVGPPIATITGSSASSADINAIARGPRFRNVWPPAGLISCDIHICLAPFLNFGPIHAHSSILQPSQSPCAQCAMSTPHEGSVQAQLTALERAIGIPPGRLPLLSNRRLLEVLPASLCLWSQKDQAIHPTNSLSPNPPAPLYSTTRNMRTRTLTLVGRL